MQVVCPKVSPTGQQTRVYVTKDIQQPSTVTNPCNASMPQVLPPCYHNQSQPHPKGVSILTLPLLTHPTDLLKTDNPLRTTPPACLAPQLTAWGLARAQETSSNSSQVLHLRSDRCRIEAVCTCAPEKPPTLLCATAQRNNTQHSVAGADQAQNNTTHQTRLTRPVPSKQQKTAQHSTNVITTALSVRDACDL